MSISKVADLAGVSNSTVSRVLNNHPRVAPETAKVVRAAMRKLHYFPSKRRPGPKPGSRSKSSTLVIGFFVLGTTRSQATPGFRDLLRGVSDALLDRGMDLRFAHVNDAGEFQQRMNDRSLDGLLLHGALPSAVDPAAVRQLPVVWLMANRMRPVFGDQVLPDAHGVGDMAAKYLLERGHKQLAYLNLDRGHWNFRTIAHAFSTTAADHGSTVQLVEQVREDVAGGYWSGHRPAAVEALAMRLLQLETRPTGLFVADDMQAALLQPALQRLGVEIGPGKSEIVSCNNEMPYLVGLDPRPVSIDIRIETIGWRGVDQLLWRIDHRNASERIIISIEPRMMSEETTPEFAFELTNA